MLIQNTLLVKFIILLVSSEILAVIWPCKSNIDCESLDLNAVCSNGGSCLCPPGQVYSTSTIACIDAVLLGDKCKEDAQCSLMPTGAGCIEGICQCYKGYTYVHGQCKKLSKLGENCSKDFDCWFGYDRASVKCSKTCVCSQGYYQRHSEICRKKSKELEPCVVHTDCITKNCTSFFCGDNRTINKTSKNSDLKLLQPKEVNNTKENSSLYDTVPDALKKFGDSCPEISAPCEGLDHSICIENLCYCQQGYYPHPTTKICTAELGEPAASSKLCEHEIVSGICSCKRNFYQDNSLRTCRKSIVFTAPCTADNQCSPYAAYCRTEKPRKCICPPYSNYDDEKQLCIKTQGLGVPCEGQEHCPTKNSICSQDKICTCKENYYESNGTCLKGIGATCTVNRDCEIENAICFKEDIEGKNTCVCHPEFINVSNRCLKIAKHIDEDCEESQQCAIMEANCVKQKCVCAENQHYSYGKCELKKHIGQSCSRIAECFITLNKNNVECRNSVCACKDSYQNNFDGITCVKSTNNSSTKVLALINTFNYFIIISVLMMVYSACLYN